METAWNPFGAGTIRTAPEPADESASTTGSKAEIRSIAGESPIVVIVDGRRYEGLSENEFG